MIAQIVNGSPVEVSGDITLPNEAIISLASVQLWTEEERNAEGLYTIVEPTPPEGQVIATIGGLAFDGTTVSQEATFQDAPPPPRRLIPKSLVQERVNSINKLDDVLALLNAPGNGIYYARWFAPDWPNVFADDAGMIGMLTMVGCTPEEIAMVTAE